MFVHIIILFLISYLTNLDCIDYASYSVQGVDNVPIIEINALFDLYNATNGPDWAWGQAPGSRWNFSSDANPCIDNWQGVSCTTSYIDGYLHVENLELPAYQLRGSIPESIGNLSKLINLALPYNYLSAGPIPDTIGNLSLLRSLHLDNSLLPGRIPTSLGNLLKLTELELTTNYLTGSIPDALCALYQLTGLYLDACELSGSIPSCFANLTELQVLQLSQNALTGTLPDSLGQLVNLRALAVDINSLHGPFPDSYRNLLQLEVLDVGSNKLSGPVPQYLGTLVQLEEIDISANFITGMLPTDIGNLKELLALYIFQNRISGTIPSTIVDLHQMKQLELYHNDITGTLPIRLDKLTRLNYINVQENRLSGVIPTALGNITELQELWIGSNYFSGNIPDVFVGEDCQLALFFANDNFLTGTIPYNLLNIPNIRALELSINQLTGQIPEIVPTGQNGLYFFGCASNYLSGSFPRSLGEESVVAYLNFSYNLLSGPLPDNIDYLCETNFIYLSSNLFSGSIPEGWGDFLSLSYLYLDKNLFTGVIPDTLGDIRFLQSLNLSCNLLSGTIPRSLSRLHHISVLMMQDNRLTGSLQGIFNYTTQKNLSTLQVSNNQLTGSLPEDLYRLQALQVFAAVSNCFEGSIPTSLCSSPSLITLALDGLQSATSCQRKLFPAALEGSVVAKGLYSIENPLSGGVPACLFAMENLTTLHLSGNGLTGTLPSVKVISSTLRDLSLSHNKLSGTIPTTILQQDWYNLDLSYNRFTGSLRSKARNSYSPKATLTLNNNRVSGVIPESFNDLDSIDVLESNLFSCNSDGSDLPKGDPNHGKYECGSSVLDDALYAWLAFVAVVVAAFATVLVTGRFRVCGCVVEEVDTVQLRKWWDAGVGTAPQLMKLYSAIELLCRTAAVCTVFVLVVLLPVYVVCSALYGTYTHQYAWIVSAAYLSGKTAFTCEFVGLLLLLVVTVASFMYFTATSAEASKNSPFEFDGEAENGQIRPALRYSLYAAVVLGNFCVVLGANAAFIIIALNQNGNQLTLAQIALASFKVTFNGVCSPLLMRWACQRFLGRQPSAPSYVSLQLFVSVLNNVLVPCLVVSIISPDCFYNVFETAADVTAQFQFAGKCVAYDTISRDFLSCLQEEVLVAETSYSPPFIYSYQCSSSFITYYSPAFVIMCIITGFGIPIVEILLLHLHQRSAPGGRWNHFLNILLPRMYQPIVSSTCSSTEINIFQPYFDASQHVITLLMYLALLLTFGAVFPPMAVCFALTMVSVTVFTRLKVGRFLSIVSDKKQSADTSEEGNIASSSRSMSAFTAADTATSLSLSVVLEQECEGVGNNLVLKRAVALLVVISSLFYTLFLYDTLGNELGLEKAFWVLIVTPLMLPVFLLALKVAWECRRVDNNSSSSSGSCDAEMTTWSISSAASPMTNHLHNTATV